MRFIGSKNLLLENIHQVIKEKAPTAKSFFDVFSGTACVARYFKKWYEVYSNDILYFSYVLQMGTVENDCIPSFDNLMNLTKGTNIIEYLNTRSTEDMEVLEQSKRFFQNTYAPTGGRMYITDENALRIDFARNTIEDWKTQGLITQYEYYYLVACVVEGIPFVSNISGTYGAYHKTWERRSHKVFQLVPLDVTTNNRNNRCYNEDGVALLTQISGDILYVDPPYNSRQYLPNYHVLETAAKYDYPEVRGITGQRPYEGQKSDFCSKKTVLLAFEDLMRNARFNHIILSYSSDGLMSVHDIEKVMKQQGKPSSFFIYEIPYRRYKSRELTKQDKLKEFLFYIEK
ncbi:MAG: adenine methyltransferase [Tissierellaceae bacterium]|jgi:adenine-specific DNA-methyltransferase|nr:adenine methyltransferase [Tissierellaceae bacterium]